MNKRSHLIHITPLPPHVPRSLVIDIFHDHEEMIRLNPLVMSHNRCAAPPDASPDELQSVWYEITDKISYLPGLSGSVTYKACFHDLPTALQTHVYAPAGVRIRGRWTVGGNMPGEPREPVELGRGDVPMEGLYVREEVDLTCNVFLSGVTKKNLKKAHKELVDRLLNKAEAFKDQNANPEQDSLPPPPSQQRNEPRLSGQSSSGSDNANAFYTTADAATRPQGYANRNSRTVSMITVELPGSTPTTPVKDMSVNSSRYSFSGSTDPSRRNQSHSLLSHKHRNSSHHSFSNYNSLDIPQPVSESVENESDNLTSSQTMQAPNRNSRFTLSPEALTDPSNRFSRSSYLSTGSPYTALALQRSLDAPLPSLARGTTTSNATHPTRSGQVLSRGSIVELPAHSASPFLHSVGSGRGSFMRDSAEVTSLPQSASPTISEGPAPVEKDTDTEIERDNEDTSLNPSTVPTSPELDTHKEVADSTTIDPSDKDNMHNERQKETAPNDETETDTPTNITEARAEEDAVEEDIDDTASEESVDLPVMTTDTLPSPTRPEPPMPAWKEGKVLLL